MLHLTDQFFQSTTHCRNVKSVSIPSPHLDFPTACWPQSSLSSLLAYPVGHSTLLNDVNNQTELEVLSFPHWIHLYRAPIQRHILTGHLAKDETGYLQGEGSRQCHGKAQELKAPPQAGYRVGHQQEVCMNAGIRHSQLSPLGRDSDWQPSHIKEHRHGIQNTKDKGKILKASRRENRSHTKDQESKCYQIFNY